jgi:hypothetical protein
MCEHLNMTDLVDMPEDGIVRRQCGPHCAKCGDKRNADFYGAELPYIPSPLIHPDIIGPEEERELRELMLRQIEQRREIELQEGELWLFD